MNQSILAVTVASLLSYTSYSYAQSNTADETVVVTANRFEQSQASALSNVEIITRQDIEQTQAKTLPDILRRLTGIQLSQNGGRGQLASIYVRGTNSDQVLVLVDGIRFARAAKGSVDFNQIPLTYVDRIEYIRGARASLYGSEAIGGVINIITVARSQQEETKLSAGLGSLDYQELSLRSGVEVAQDGQLNVAVGYESDDGYNVKPQPGVNDGDRHGFESKNALVGYVHDLNQNWSLFANVRAYENIYQYDSSFGSHQYYEGEKDNIAAALGAKFQSNKLMSELTYSKQKQKEWDYEQKEGKHSGRIGELEQQNVQWTNSYLLSDNIVVAGGVDWRDESYADKVANEEFDRTNSAAFAVVSANVDKATLELSGRADDNEQFGKQYTYSIGAGYEFIPEFGIKSTFGTAFKAPDLYQLNDPYSGNKTLAPEESDAWDITIGGVIQSVRWSVTGYDYKIDNIIEYNFDTYKFANIEGRSHIRGIEVVSEFDTGIVQHQVSAEFKDPEDANGKQLSRRSNEIYKWNALVVFDEVDWSIGYQYIGERPDGSNELPAYSLFDTAVSYYANESTTISARIDNVFDEEFETVKGYPAAERAYYLNVNYAF